MAENPSISIKQYQERKQRYAISGIYVGTQNTEDASSAAAVDPKPEVQQSAI
jgi:hypothetical protein